MCSGSAIPVQRDTQQTGEKGIPLLFERATEGWNLNWSWTTLSCICAHVALIIPTWIMLFFVPLNCSYLFLLQFICLILAVGGLTCCMESHKGLISDLFCLILNGCTFIWIYQQETKDQLSLLCRWYTISHFTISWLHEHFRVIVQLIEQHQSLAQRQQVWTTLESQPLRMFTT